MMRYLIVAGLIILPAISQAQQRPRGTYFDNPAPTVNTYQPLGQVPTYGTTPQVVVPMPTYQYQTAPDITNSGSYWTPPYARPSTTCIRVGDFNMCD